MRNFKKISAVVVAGAIMLTSIVPAFASTYTPVNGNKAVVLNKLELYAGTSNDSFVPSLETKLTRGQGATLLAKLFNMDDAAMALTDAEAAAILKNFADAGKVPEYAKKRLAYLVKNNIMSGSQDTKTGKVYVNADESLLGGQFATLILKQLGFTVASWSEAVSQLADVKGAKDIADYLAYATKAVLRDQAVGIMFGSLTSEYADGKATVIEKIVEAKPALRAIAEEAGLIAAPAQLDIEKISVTNLREMVVTFNKAVNKTIAEDKTKYKIDDNNPESAILSDDGKTVTLRTLNANAMSNYDSDVKLFISKDLGFAADKTVTGIAAKDTTVPSAVSIVTTGPKNIKVTLSEPLNETVTAANIASSLKIDDGMIAIDNTGVTLSGNTLSIRTYSDLYEGNHKIEFLTNSNMFDNAGYKFQASTLTFNYVKDTSALSFNVTESSETSVTIKFNKAIAANTFAGNPNVKITHTYNTDTNSVLASTAVTTTDDQTFKIDFGSTKPLAPGQTNVYIKYVSDSGTLIADNYGNKLAATTFAVTTAADTTKPTVTSVTFVDSKTVTVAFSEAINKAIAETAGNYLLKSGNDTVAVTNAVWDPTDNTVDLTTATMNGGTYTLTIKNMTDLSVAKNVMDTATVTFTGTDKVAPTVSAAKLMSAKIFKITFSEAMDSASITDKNAYKVKLANGSYTALDTEDTIVAADGNKAAVITFKTAPLSTSYVVMARVKDTAGNWSEKYTEEFPVSTVTTVALDSYQVTGKNSIKLVVKDTLNSLNVNDFLYTTGPAASYVTPKAISVSIADGYTYITLITDDLASTTGAGIKVKTNSTVSSKNTYDSLLSFDATSGIVDKCAPLYTTVSSITTGAGLAPAGITSATTNMAIVIDYSEPIYAASVSEADYTVAGYTVDAVEVVGNQVKIYSNDVDLLTLPVGTSVTVQQVGDIQDMAKNTLSTQSAWTANVR